MSTAVSALADILDTAGDTCLERVRADYMAALIRRAARLKDGSEHGDSYDCCSDPYTHIGSILADFFAMNPRKKSSGLSQDGVISEAKILLMLDRIREKEGNAAVKRIIKDLNTRAYGSRENGDDFCGQCAEDHDFCRC